jgi:L,D-peptidoglycan transpeptidase YkuD (ErfK/YbiS/YcfS/YnhG family)
MGKSLAAIRVRARPGSRAQGLLDAGSLQLRVALGRSGIRANKREGDGATPRGRFRPLRLWWRADRGPRPQTGLPIRLIGRSDGWCEEPDHPRYNRPIRVAEGSAADCLWREDRLYDLIVEIDHNTRPRVARRGSAVFIHVARPGFQPTAGCIALRLAALRRLVARLGRNTRIIVH